MPKHIGMTCAKANNMLLITGILIAMAMPVPFYVGIFLALATPISTPTILNNNDSHYEYD